MVHVTLLDGEQLVAYGAPYPRDGKRIGSLDKLQPDQHAVLFAAGGKQCRRWSYDAELGRVVETASL
jgi:hypothetical protein